MKDLKPNIYKFNKLHPFEDAKIIRSESATELSLKYVKNRDSKTSLHHLTKINKKDSIRQRDLSENFNTRMLNKKDSISKSKLEINAYTEHGDYAIKIPQSSWNNPRFELSRKDSKQKFGNQSKQESSNNKTNFQSVHHVKIHDDGSKQSTKRTDSRKPLNFRNIDRKVNQSVNTSTIRSSKVVSKAAIKNK